ncbi:MAG: PAS domain S-box protein, partial [Gemmatimonadales bacterium]
RLAVLDIVPTHAMWHDFSMQKAMKIYHWLFLAQPKPLPEMLVGRAPVLLWTTNSEGVIDFVSGAALGDLGGREEIIGRRIHDLSPNPQMAETVLRRGLGGETLNFTMPIRDRLFEVSTGPWHNERGQTVGIIGVCIDVTRRQVAEQQLRAAVDNAPLMLWTTDRKGVLTFMQGAAMASVGYTPENTIGRAIDSMGDNEELGREIIRRCLAGETFAYEAMLRGRFFESSAAPLHGAGGEIAGIIGVSIDITDQRQAKRDLEAQREQMELIFRHSWDGLCIREMELGSYKRRLIMFNDMFAQMSGFGREELMARYGTDKLLHHHNSDLERRRQREMILGGKAIQGVDSWVRPDGKENYHEFTSVPIRRDDKHILIVDIRRDITDRLKTEEALKLAHRQLVTAREQERRRLARELHDSIGQGLVALQLSMRTVLSESSIPPGQALAQRVTEATQQCSRLVGEIRQLCHGLYPPTLESLGLVAALQQLVRSCGNSGPPLELQHDEQLSSRRFSPDVEITLFRIAQEALSNAIRHSQATRIGISLTLTPDGLLWLRITDDGKGFDVESGKHGLGMISMKERAHSVGGVLVICSEPGQSVVKAGVPVQVPTPAS